MNEFKIWWVDLDESTEEDDISVGTLLREHPRQGPLNWQESLSPVVKKSDYDTLKSKLEKAEAVISFYADENNWKTMEHCEYDTISKVRVQAQDYDNFGLSEYGEASRLMLVGGKQAREYLKGEG